MNISPETLAEKINQDLQKKELTTSEKFEISEKIQNTSGKDFIVIAQTDSLSGNIKGNTQKALKWIKWAQEIQADAIIFPELFLTGVVLGDIPKKYPIIVDENIEWLKALTKFVTGKTNVVIGFIDKDLTKNENYNAVAVLSEGKIEKIITKSLLKNCAEKAESRIFSTREYKNGSELIKIGSKNVKIIIGELAENLKASRDSISKEKPDYIINCDASASRTNKDLQKEITLQNTAKQNNIPILYVNTVGTTDCISFNGESKVINAKGQTTIKAKAFEEDFCIVKTESLYEEKPDNTGLSVTSTESFSLDYEYDLKRTYQTIVQSIKSYFKNTGFKRAVLGLSGGLDSTVSAVLLADALGAQNVLGISMPSKITSKESKSDARQLAENLGIKFTEMPIKDMFETTRNTFDKVFADVEKNWNCKYKESYTNDNIQARSRAMILWGVANEFGQCLPIATSDKSELYMGYATINGDMSGGFAPLADVTKTKLFALAKWLNKNRTKQNTIPTGIIERRPGAELAINPKTGKPLLAEEALMPYEFLDEIIWRVENKQQNINDMQNEEFLYEKAQKCKGTQITTTQKQEWLHKFFKRMSTGVYKWNIMPPFPIVDTHSINCCEYKQPIVASKMDFAKTEFKEKTEALE